MRWLSFFILAYVVLGLQLGLGGFITYQGAGPSLVLIAVLFIATNAPRDQALLGSFLLGLFQDLISVQPLGLYAFTFGVIGLMVVGSKQVTYSDHPLTHFFLALASGLLMAVVLYVHGLLRPPGLPIEVGGETLPALRVSAGELLLKALYTAVLAPLVLWLLTKLKPAFGFRPARSRY